MQLLFRLKTSPAFIFDLLSDMQKFASVHPVISMIDKTGDETYLVHETLKFGPFPFSFTYPVTMEKHSIDKVIIMRATVFKITKIKMQFVIKADNDETIIEEHIQFKSPLPIGFFMQNIFSKQHTQLFKNIAAKLAY